MPEPVLDRDVLVLVLNCRNDETRVRDQC